MNSLYLFGVIPVALAAIGGAVWVVLRSRNMEIWIGSYLQQRWRKRPAAPEGIRHVYFCFADHYEPYWMDATREQARQRVAQWSEHYPAVATAHTDSDGNHPVHSFFYPAEQYDREILDALGEFRDQGIGDIEIHLHHDDDTAEKLYADLTGFRDILHNDHGFLRKEPDSGQIVYAFIHGNWALDNSSPDGRWCGVDNEFDVLVRSGCRVDMTMPSAPSATQTKIINSIYFTKGADGRRKSHNTGTPLRVGEWRNDDSLLLIQGPLELNWKQRKLGLLPKIESSDVCADNPPTRHRIQLWEQANIHVDGAEQHLFIKIHTHGAEDDNIDMLFNGGGFDLIWTELEKQYRDREGYALHYVSAWSMYEKVRELADR